MGSSEKKSADYNLRTKNLCKLLTIKSTIFGLESLSFRGSFFWKTLDDSTKNEPTLLVFENKIKKWSGKRMHMQDLPPTLYFVFHLFCIGYFVYGFVFCIVNSWFKLILS